MQWEPYREPFRSTLLRTGTIALIGGGALARSLGGLSYWPIGFLLVLWPALGGHYVEIGFLNYLRPQLPDGGSIQALTRVLVWFLGGTVLTLGMTLTARISGVRTLSWSACWYGGLAFIGIELAAHFVLWLRRKPNAYDRRG